MNAEQMPGWYFAHAQIDLNLLILRMIKGNVSLDAAHMIMNPNKEAPEKWFLLIRLISIHI